MPTQERRTYHRTRLRLRISKIEGLTLPDGTGNLWTSDVSPGGMYVHTPLAEAPAMSTKISFELTIPPGEGYSLSAGHVRGSGKVIRVDPSAEPVAGIAIGFTSPLAMHF